MSAAPLLDAELAGTAHEPPAAGRDRSAALLLGGLAAFFGWGLRLLLGAVFCTHYFTGILVVGFLSRRTQAVVVRRWWLRSRFREDGTFAAFAEGVGPDAPVMRPRWLWQERALAHLGRPGPDGGTPGVLRVLARLFVVPWDSAYRNLSAGIKGLFGTFLLAGPGCLLMTAGWEYGWQISFHKVYELSPVGATVSVTGILLFVAAMIYVPMAQAHYAAAGECRAFFDFRVVLRLVRVRAWAYAGLALLTGLAALPLLILRTLPKFFEQMNPWFETATDAQYLAFMEQYTFWNGALLFASLVVLRGLAARIYASALLEALRRGAVTPEQVPAALADWLTRLEMWPTPEPSRRGRRPGLLLALFGSEIWMLRSAARRLPYALVGVVWFLFVAGVYVGEFLNYHPVVGFLNHPLVQLPCVNYIPPALKPAP